MKRQSDVPDDGPQPDEPQASGPGRASRPEGDQPLSADDRARADARALGQLIRIERGAGNPAITTLMKIAQGMQVPVGSFLQADQEPQGLLVRKEHRKRLVPSEGLIYELLTPDLKRRLEVLRVQIAPGFDNSERPFTHDGEECVHLLEGELLIYIGGTEYHLEEGDSITYDPAVPHWYRNPFSRPSLGFGVITPPGF